MKKITAFVVAIVAALALATGASAGRVHEVVDGGGGGAPTISVWIEVVYTYVNGYPLFWYCRYASDGQVVWQLDCWS